MRAALMGTFILFNLSLNRKADITNVLVLSAFCITFFRPEQIFRPGFILSYLAVLSIIYITPFTDTLLGLRPATYERSRIKRAFKYVLKALSLSIAIWIGMMPVIAAYFHIITPVVILSNLLAVPVLFVLVVLGFGLTITGAIPFLAPITWIFVGTINSIVPLFVKIMRDISNIPFSSIRVSSPGMVGITIFFLFLFAIDMAL